MFPSRCFYLAAALLCMGCGKSEDGDASAVGGAGALLVGDDGKPVTLTEGFPWPPPYLIHYLGLFGEVPSGLAIAVDETYVYWWHNFNIMRGDKMGGGDHKSLITCHLCDAATLDAEQGEGLNPDYESMTQPMYPSSVKT